MDNELTIGEKLKKRRNELNLTLKELSEKSGISLQLINDYENNRKEPGIKNLKTLCDSMGLFAGNVIDDNAYFYTEGKANTVGLAVEHYLEALKISNKDKIIIENNHDVYIKINNPYVSNILTIFNNMNLDKTPNLEFYDAFKNFLANMSGNIDIDKNFINKK